MKIVLIGFMGSGKSKVGEILARNLGWEHVDTDKLIVEKAGMSIPEIFTTKGEPAFRELERHVISQVSKRDHCVISTGGGVPLNPDNMTDLSKDGFVVWLKVSPEIVLRRAGDFSTRPLIDPRDPIGSVKKRLQERFPFYSKASLAVDTDRSSLNEVVEKIIESVPGLKK